MDTPEAASTQSRLAASLAASSTAVVAETRTEARVAVERRLAKCSRRRGVIIGCVRRNTVGLAIHASLSVRSKPSLAVS